MKPIDTMPSITKAVEKPETAVGKHCASHVMRFCTDSAYLVGAVRLMAVVPRTTGDKHIIVPPTLEDCRDFVHTNR